MSTGSTAPGTNDTMITFGAGTSVSVQWTRLRYRYGNSALYFEPAVCLGTTVLVRYALLRAPSMVWCNAVMILLY
ncbi:MAG: hypothetical protein WKF77_24455 [Planctomycetaceae bacterium]